MSNYKIGDVVDLEWKDGKNAGKKCGRAKVIGTRDGKIHVVAIVGRGGAYGRKGQYNPNGDGVASDYNTNSKRIRGLSKNQVV